MRIVIDMRFEWKSQLNRLYIANIRQIMLNIIKVLIIFQVNPAIDLKNNIKMI
jgi:hypothetical protein